MSESARPTEKKCGRIVAPKSLAEQAENALDDARRQSIKRRFHEERPKKKSPVLWDQIFKKKDTP